MIRRFSVYHVKVSHGMSVLTLGVTARNKKAAIRQVMAAEGCPERAIVEIKKVNRPYNMHGRKY